MKDKALTDKLFEFMSLPTNRGRMFSLSDLGQKVRRASGNPYTSSQLADALRKLADAGDISKQNVGKSVHRRWEYGIIEDPFVNLMAKWRPSKVLGFSKLEVVHNVEWRHIAGR